MKTLLKSTSENRKTGFVLKSKFSATLKEKNNIKKILENDLKYLEENRDQLDASLA